MFRSTTNMVQRSQAKVLDDLTCQLCGSEHENTMHALWYCKDILTVWESGFGWLRKDFPMVVSFSDLVSLVGEHSKRLELFASVAWSIWCRRNKMMQWIVFASWEDHGLYCLTSDLLGSKTLGLNVLELQFVMLANHDQNVLVFVLDLLKVCLYVKLESSVLQDLLCKSAWLDR